MIKIYCDVPGCQASEKIADMDSGGPPEGWSYVETSHRSSAAAIESLAVAEKLKRKMIDLAGDDGNIPDQILRLIDMINAFAAERAEEKMGLEFRVYHVCPDHDLPFANASDALRGTT